MDRLPDYSNTYFPPPPGASGTGSSQTTIGTYYPPPPERTTLPNSSNRPTQSPPTGLSYTSIPSLSHDEFTSVNPTTYQHSSPHLSHQHVLPSPYQPHASVYQGSPLPSPSLLPPAAKTARTTSPAFRTRFASLSLHRSDCIRFLRFPPALYSLLRTTIESAWTRGIQSEHIAPSVLEIKLKGIPWSIHSSGGAITWSGEGQEIHAQRLICALLRVLHGEGWVLMHSTDISQVQFDADTLLFRHQMPAPMPQEWFSLVFTEERKLRFVDAPRALCIRVLEHFSAQKMEMKFKEHPKVEGCCEVKFAATWRSLVHVEPLNTRMMFLDLLECIEESGWTLYASVDQNTRGDEKGMTDTWYCCRPVGWAEGNPVYHN